jgi:hypothetical protein
MADGSDSIEWNLVDLVARWNVYGLPVLLLVVAVIAWVRHRSRPTKAGWDDGLRTVRRIGLIHCVLAIQVLIALAQELLAIRAMGIPQSHIRLIGVIIGTAVNPLLGIGLLCRRPLARWFAIAWYAISSLVAILVISWLSYYHIAIDAASWPEQLISKVMPFVLLVTMLLPRTKSVFAKLGRPESVVDESSDPKAATARSPESAGRPVVSLLTLLFLVVVCSNLVVDVVDWAYRLIFESEVS